MRDAFRTGRQPLAIYLQGREFIFLAREQQVVYKGHAVLGICSPSGPGAASLECAGNILGLNLGPVQSIVNRTLSRVNAAMKGLPISITATANQYADSPAPFIARQQSHAFMRWPLE